MLFRIPIILVTFLLLSFKIGEERKEFPTKGYWAMKGTLAIHAYFDEQDSLSGKEIYELKDENGLTIWFGRYIFKDVCITGICRMIKLWLFWDGAGNYLDIQMLDGEYLTKSDHTAFNTSDYKKLHAILSDRDSPLRNLTYEDLTSPPENNLPFKVDGYSSATRPALLEVVVKDAVYTCHSLWHTVYGSTRKKIIKILDDKSSSEYVKLMMTSKNPSYISWSIQQVFNKLEWHHEFYPQIIEYVNSDDELLYQLALDYFSDWKIKDERIQMELATIVPKVNSQRKIDILWKLIEIGEVDEDVVFELLKYFDAGIIRIGSLNLILKLIQPKHLEHNGIKNMMDKLALHNDLYVRNMVFKFTKQAE
jgi:hypothetical protein